MDIRKQNRRRRSGKDDLSRFSQNGSFQLEAAIRADGGRRPTMLLHSCCGPCSTSVIERLSDRFHLTVCFYNPNITNAGEYRRRLETERQFITQYNERVKPEDPVKLIEGPYEPERFLEAVRGLEQEPENGARCAVCFRLRMQKVAEEADRRNFDMFATTLTVSPHKHTPTIHAIGYELEKAIRPVFLDENFKKRDGFRRSTELSAEYGLYRQNFCGCRFSYRPDAVPENPAEEYVE